MLTMQVVVDPYSGQQLYLHQTLPGLLVKGVTSRLWLLPGEI